MSKPKDFGFGTQIRKSPYFDSTLKWGAQGFSVYNHMYIPRDFGDPEQNFWNLVNDAIICDVAVERQVEITGPDAAEFIKSNIKKPVVAYIAGLTAPEGTPHSLQISTNSITTPGVIVSGLIITEQPAASAVDIFLAAKTSGKFQGDNAATTPTG